METGSRAETASGKFSVGEVSAFLRLGLTPGGPPRLFLFVWQVTPWLVVVLCAVAAAGVAELPRALHLFGL
jgi:hypothetical protein